ncbi:MAG: ABC transporter substrate-binding protein [Candidatus Dormibacteraeota bacterium]|nr:ABC transporter substrate-binding protein [Candidatus Dormibacteraeota bacterium]
MNSARRLSRRELLKDGVILGAAIAVAGCGPFQKLAQTGATPGKRLTLSWWLDTGYPSPFTFSNIGPGGVVKETMLFDSLLWKDARGLIPWLAETWQVEDGGRTIVFRLRGNAAWHDGKPFTADDAAFSFGYFAKHPFSWADLTPVASAVANDSRMLTITLREPFAPFLNDIAGVLPMIPKHVWSTVSDPLKFQGPAAVIGTGPFTFASYVAGQGAYLFKANDNFFRGRPAFRELAYTVLPDAQQPLALEGGQVDSAFCTVYDVQARFNSGPYRVLKTPPHSMVRLVFNVNRPPFDKVAFRRTIAYGLDRARIAQRVLHGDVIVGNPGVIPPETPWYRSDVRQYPYEVSRAKASLAGGGYDRSTVVQLLTEPDTPDAELVKSMLGEVGIQVQVVAVDPKTRGARMKALDYQMALVKHIGVGGDPDFLRRWYVAQPFSAFEYGNVMHRRDFDALAQQQAHELNAGRRKALVDQMQGILADELPTLPLYHRRIYLIYRQASWDRWFNTWGGMMAGIPLMENKLALVL